MAIDWQYWKQNENPRVWQAVALSLNINPPHDWNMLDKDDFPEFRLRLRKATSRSGPFRLEESGVDRGLDFHSQQVQAAAAVLAPPRVLHRVALPQFAKTASELGWAIPPELAAMAGLPAKDWRAECARLTAELKECREAAIPVQGKKLTSALKLIRLLASKYPSGEKAAGSIATQLDAKGWHLDETTVRDWLNSALKKFPPGKKDR